MIQNQGCGDSVLLAAKRLVEEEVQPTPFFFASFLDTYLSSLDLCMQHQCRSGPSKAFEVALLHRQTGAASAERKVNSSQSGVNPIVDVSN